MADSPELVDFAIGVVNSVLNLPNEQVNFLLQGGWGERGGFTLQKNSNQCSTKVFSDLVEVTFGLVHASYSLPKWQAVKLTFFAPGGDGDYDYDYI